ncbi:MULTISPECIES: hypothetical protein [unclassified Crossiella]|uniref:hypothetical protein n=1 Tax=unclassified Crossiella TaxID=2620835 RepID=UPI001FFFE8BF|nr:MULTISPECIES: hypothetical protein [unclassified Crossiella]MCK2240679.1 hypothetical protein [Crossiella sp. S99.2]MCK2252870.1 hypothetical protein [Crossiella sp. S99.1]
MEAVPQPVVSRDWRPVWWALSEFGWLDETLLGDLDRLPDACGRPPARHLVRRLSTIGWLARDRAPGRPARPIRVTPSGVEAISNALVSAPLWTAPSREVARRALAVALPVRGQHDVPAVCQSVAEVAASWGRLVREVDVRQAVQEWRTAGWIVDTAVPPGRWRLTELGRRCARAVASSTATAAPRRPRQQDQVHDQLLISAVRRLLLRWPGVLGTLRVARRLRLDESSRPGWVIPDAVVGFQCADRRLLLVIEAERRGRYDGLARHIRRLGWLAELLPGDTVHVAVLCARRSPGRVNAVAGALAESGSSVAFRAVVTTPATLPRQLVEWGIDGQAVPIQPLW